MNIRLPTTRRAFLGTATAGGLAVAFASATVLSGCSDDSADEPAARGTDSDATSTTPRATTTTTIVPPAEAFREWAGLGTPEVIEFGRAVARVDPDAVTHATARLSATRDPQEPADAMQALADACDRDVDDGALVTALTWTMPRTLGGLAAGLAAAD